MRRTIVMPVEKRFLSSTEAQSYLGMSSDFFDRLRENAKIKYYMVGRCVFYEKKDIDNLVLSNPRP